MKTGIMGSDRHQPHIEVQVANDKQPGTDFKSVPIDIEQSDRHQPHVEVKVAERHREIVAGSQAGIV